MTLTTDYACATFERLSTTDRPAHTSLLFNAVCVLGGSIAGLLAARVLSDHARTVLIIERDAVNIQGRSRIGVPHDRQGHLLLPGGLGQIERWLPGFTRETQARGGALIGPDRQAMYLGDHQAMPIRETPVLAGTRPFLESRIRSRVLALPNVLALSARASGLVFRDGAVQSVLYKTGRGEQLIDVDFVVDAMGRSSKLSDWVGQAGFQRPALQRLRTDINYATAMFDRPQDPVGLPLSAITRFTPPSGPDGLTVAGVVAVEGNQWIVQLMTYEPDRPATTLDAFRATCAKLPPTFRHAVRGSVTRGIETYRQADSRRRDYTAITRFPARLVSVGDAVASFNPIYGQGMSSAALHASCLSEYLTATPSLDRMATEFFDLQAIVTDAAWTMSAGGDAARLDAINRVDVPEDVAQQRWNFDQVSQATLVDQSIADAFGKAAFMLIHPAKQTDPALVERAIAANQH